MNIYNKINSDNLQTNQNYSLNNKMSLMQMHRNA